MFFFLVNFWGFWSPKFEIKVFFLGARVYIKIWEVGNNVEGHIIAFTFSFLKANLFNLSYGWLQLMLHHKIPN
jgi:hypothetical protein